MKHLEPEELRKKIKNNRAPLKEKLSFLELYLSFKNNEHKERIRVIIEEGKFEPENLENVLFENIRTFKPEYLDVFLDYGVSLDSVDKDSNSLLMASIIKENNALSLLLIEKGADIFYKNKHGTNALYSSIGNKSNIMKSLLIKSQLMERSQELVNSKSTIGTYPLTIAASIPDNGKCVDILLNYKPIIEDIEDRDKILEQANKTSKKHFNMIKSYFEKYDLKKEIQVKNKTKSPSL